MNVFAHIEGRTAAAIDALKKEGALPSDLAVPDIGADVPRDPTHGDIAINSALALAKAAKMKPRDIAELIAAKLKAEPGVAKVDIAGPGFINLTFAPSYWQGLVKTIITEGKRYGADGLGKDETVNIEYVSANPTGPMHVGHCRGAVFGDALANLLAFAGYDVTREYYVNDAGGQVEVLAQLCVPALPRGAGRGHRPNSGRALSRRLPEAGRCGAGRRSMARSCSKCSEAERLPSRPQGRYRGHAGDDQGGSRRARHQARRLLL